MNQFTLSNGVVMPAVAFGTYKAAEGDTADVIRTALEVGYRCLDTASFYGTEPYIARAIRDSGVDRRELFLTSKLWRDEMGYQQTMVAFGRTLERLETNYLDLYLIHWPRPDRMLESWRELDLETWTALEELYEAGKVRAIGVSNFLPQHLEPLLEKCRVRPMVDQLELHPGYAQPVAVRFCQEQHILVQAWSPMGRTRVLADPLVDELAKKYGVSPAQICLRYALQKQAMPLPKASTAERMRQNLEVFDFVLSREDLFRLDTMPQTGWSGEHPDYL